jgi:hypothetical protein
MVATGPTTTVTVAVPDLPPLVAWTVAVNTPGTVPAVKMPFASTAPPPARIDHCGEISTTAPSASLPTARNCCVALTARVGFGETTMLVSEPGPVGPCTSHAAATIVVRARTTRMRPSSPGGPGAEKRTLELVFMTLLEGVLAWVGLLKSLAGSTSMRYRPSGQGARDSRKRHHRPGGWPESITSFG